MVRGLNKVQIIGNLGRDPEMRYTPSGSAVTNFTVAVNRPRRAQDGGASDETEWFRVVLWDKLAETASEFLRKGGAPTSKGACSHGSTPQGRGRKDLRVKIVGNEMILLGAREDGQGGQGAPREGGEERGRGGYWRVVRARTAPRVAIAPHGLPRRRISTIAILMTYRSSAWWACGA